jgi:hypothetical protein
MLQEFLGALMIKVHGDNFVPATAHYSHGDLKCDGLLHEPLRWLGLVEQRFRFAKWSVCRG